LRVGHSVDTDALVRGYLTAKRAVIESGYLDEVVWQADAGNRALTSRRFVREAAWVVLCAGMRESVIRRLHDRLAHAFRGFDPVKIGLNEAAVRDEALLAFAHEAKIDAIVRIASTARELGAAGLRRSLVEPEPFLRSLPYIGPVTWRHLAKNLGADVAKADRHLVRLTAAAGRPSVDVLCEEISTWIGEPTAVVDVVLWRWSVLHSTTCGTKCGGVPWFPTPEPMANGRCSRLGGASTWRSTRW
jgi:3-methyladenine DNA glycosylase Tag